jgi:hypothetical protein
VGSRAGVNASQKKKFPSFFEKQATTPQFFGPSPVNTPTELFHFHRMARRFSLEILSQIFHFIIPELMLIHPVLIMSLSINISHEAFSI